MNELEHDVMDAVRSGIAEVIKTKLGGYNSPLDKLLADVIEKHSGSLRALFIEAIDGSLTNADFREQIKYAVRHKLAQQLIQKFGGELEKQVNLLKSDPTTRAQITVAISQIVKDKSGI